MLVRFFKPISLLFLSKTKKNIKGKCPDGLYFWTTKQQPADFYQAWHAHLQPGGLVNTQSSNNRTSLSPILFTWTDLSHFLILFTIRLVPHELAARWAKTISFNQLRPLLSHTSTMQAITLKSKQLAFLHILGILFMSWSANWFQIIFKLFATVYFCKASGELLEVKVWRTELSLVNLWELTAASFVRLWTEGYTQNSKSGEIFLCQEC